MKQTLKMLGVALAVVCALAVCIYVAGEALTPRDIRVAMAAINDFHSLPEDSVEVVICGSSHAWNSCDPAQLYREYGIGAYNYACWWQSINTTALFVQDLFRTQSPKVVLVETFNAWTVAKDVDALGEVDYTRAIPMFEGKKGYLEQCFGKNRLDRYLSYYVPLFEYHENWTSMGENSFTAPKPGLNHQTLGFQGVDNHAPAMIFDYDESNEEPLPADAQAWLDRIVETCYENGAEVVFYTVPYEGIYHYNLSMQEYADMNGCYYLNFFDLFDDVGLDGETDFGADRGHLNLQGAAKVTAYLGEFLADFYDLTDYRELEGTLWNQVVELDENWREEEEEEW